MNPDVFFGLGKLEPEYHIEIEMDAKAVVHPARKIPAMLRKRLKEELDGMEKEGIIVEVEELRARENVFWPGMNRQIEDMEKACETCLTNRSQQRREPLIPSEISNGRNRFILLEWSRFPFNCRLHSRYWEI